LCVARTSRANSWRWSTTTCSAPTAAAPMPADRAPVHGQGRGYADLLRRHGWKFALLFAGVLLPMWAFMELADEVQDGEPFPFDEPILLFAQQAARDGFDRVFLFFSRIGYAWGVVPVDIGLVLLLLAL